MGPRSWDRGEYSSDQDRSHLARASMGPRSWDRGEGAASPLQNISTAKLQWGRGLGTAERRRSAPLQFVREHSFNGAAVLGPRRAPCDSHSPPGLAASMGPRSWDRGEGRARPLAHGHRGASMGPRSWDRGEAANNRAIARGLRCFNGAAVLGPRRGRDRALETRGRAASMGPRSWDRGEDERRQRSLAAGVASMGPRSWDRGEGIQPLRVRLLLALASMGPRSWDRGEIRYLDQGSRVSPLQWGRGLGTAESSLPHGHDCPERMASMGPRSWDRGEHGPRLGAVGHALASIGPRSWDRGEVTARHCATLRERGFNGAAVLGPRRASIGT